MSKTNWRPATIPTPLLAVNGNLYRCIKIETAIDNTAFAFSVHTQLCYLRCWLKSQTTNLKIADSFHLQV